VLAQGVRARCAAHGAVRSRVQLAVVAASCCPLWAQGNLFVPHLGGRYSGSHCEMGNGSPPKREPAT
jgi:hypothetical protein